jgi:hypothetical protein
LVPHPVSQVSAHWATGLPELFSPYSFRVTVVTNLLNQNAPLGYVQYLLAFKPDYPAHL